MTNRSSHTAADDDAEDRSEGFLRALFMAPPRQARQTPLFWWSGADLSRERLRWHLDHLAESGLGGTIVGYSHRPDALPDAGDPTPFTEAWWELFEWFVAESAARDLSVGIQDYNFLAGSLLRAGRRTRDFAGGTLTEESSVVVGPALGSTVAPEGEVLAVWLVAAGREPGTELEERNRSIDFTVSDGVVHYEAPTGRWIVSVVGRRPGRVRGELSDFDPMHPQAAERLIDEWYQPFAVHLGRHVGVTFTTFFQDELDFGVVMPMWNDLVAARLESVGFVPAHWLPGLWHDLGPRTVEFRGAYRDIVIDLLEHNFFRPIFEWHEEHGTTLAMDQLSRGDLRQGRRHYGDFMATMRWYHAPGNDDPNLTASRSIAAFRTSASIAALNGRTLVFNEAFYGSGWGVTRR